jgi:4-amino-4-deoxy-L-arabinose transferase-like glycosyltransferase
MTSPSLHPESRFRARLLIIVAVAAAWRVGVLIVDKWRQPLLLNDSLYYAGQAQQLARGIWFREIFVDQPGAEHGPLTSLVLAPVAGGSDPVPWMRLVTVLFGIVTVLLIGLLGRRVGGDRVGLVAASIAAIYPNLWMNDGLVMSESVSVFVVCVVLLVTLRVIADEHASRWSLVVLGACTGLGALARSELALLAVGVALLVWATAGWRWRTVVRPALVVLGAVVVVAPWVVFNMARFERPVTLTTNDGTTLLGANCDATFRGEALGGWSVLCVVSDPAYRMDEEPSVRSVRQRSLALAYVRDHVGDLPRVTAARVGRTLDLYGLGNLVQQDVGEERYRWASWAGIVMWWLLAPLAVAGAVLGVRRGLVARRDLWALALPCIAVAVTTVLFYGAHRIRSSMEPTVVVLAAVALVALLGSSNSAPASRSTTTNTPA